MCERVSEVDGVAVRYRTPWPVLMQGPEHDPALAGEHAAWMTARLVELAGAGETAQGVSLAVSLGLEEHVVTGGQGQLLSAVQRVLREPERARSLGGWRWRSA
jgi:hypothetical protein